jgi:SAM-dependent methyltransferase
VRRRRLPSLRGLSASMVDGGGWLALAGAHPTPPEPSLMSVTDYWDAMYGDRTAPDTFGGGKPSAEVVEAARRLSPGARALDLGCGDGRNPLYLAEQGCRVTGMDLSPIGVAKTQQFAAERGLHLDCFVQDMRHFVFDTSYELVVSMGCLHLIVRDEWRPLLQAIQAHTRRGGYNAIGIMTDVLPPPDDQKAYFIGLFRKDELLGRYEGWEIVSYRKTQFHDEHPGGMKHHHAGETVLARNVSG